MRIATIVAVVLFATGGLAVTERAHASMTRHELNIPRQPLDTALEDLAQQAGLQVDRSIDALPWDTLVGPVTGSYSAEQALKTLLARTSLTYQTLDDRTIIVRRPGNTAQLAAATSLPTSMESENSLYARETGEGQGAPATAGDAAKASLEEVVVTATRVAGGSQSVPISLTAISASDLQNAGVTSVTQLAQLAPNMDILSTVSAGSPRYSLRGISNQDVTPAGSSSVATYIDDVYQASLFGVTTALFDLQRVEVLRGPQGTTFGRNTTGGAIAYFSQVPVDRDEGYVTVRDAGGDRPERFLQGAINVPLIPELLATRFSFSYDNHSAYVFDQGSDRERGGGDTQSGRIQLRWTPSSGTVVNLTAFGSRIRNDTPLWYAQILPGNLFGFPTQETQYNNINLSTHVLYDNSSNYGTTLRVEQPLGQFNLTSVTHYRRTSLAEPQDLDGLPFDIFAEIENATSQQYGQEIRLASDQTQRLSGLVGLYFEKDNVDEVELQFASLDTAIFGKYNQQARFITGTNTYAAFTTLTFKVTDQLSVVGGVRKSVERKTVDGTKSFYLLSNYDWTDSNIFNTPPIAPDQLLSYKLSQKAEPVTWDGTIDYTPSSDVLLFLRAAKGFRSGGFNEANAVYPFTAAFSFPVPVPPPFSGESVQSYEIGLKSAWLDHTLRFNASVYHYNYNNQQVTTYPNGLIVTANAASSKVDGGEIEILAAPITHLELSASAGYSNARYTNYVTAIGDFTGNRLLEAPEKTFNGSATYTIPLNKAYELLTNTTWAYRSAIFWDAANSGAFRAGGQTVGNVRIALQPSSGKGFSIAAFIDNVSNKRPLESGFTFGPDYNLKLFGVGRLYGADVTYKW